MSDLSRHRASSSGGASDRGSVGSLGSKSGRSDSAGGSLSMSDLSLSAADTTEIKRKKVVDKLSLMREGMSLKRKLEEEAAERRIFFDALMLS